MGLRDYQHKEDKTFSGKDITLVFKPEDEIILRRGVLLSGVDIGVRHIVEIAIPWGAKYEIYQIGKYEKEEEAKTAFEEFKSNLEKGHPLRIAYDDNKCKRVVEIMN